MKQAEEDLLVIAAQAGNEKAFAYLFRHYHKPLLRFAFGLSRDRQLAQDAVQEAWIRIAGTLRRLDDPRAFRSWIYRAVRWRVLDLLKKPREPVVPLDENSIAQISTSPPAESTEAVELSGFMAQLPAIDRQALRLFYLQEMTIAEIAVVLGIPPGTVKSRLNRARTRMRELFEHQTRSQ